MLRQERMSVAMALRVQAPHHTRSQGGIRRQATTPPGKQLGVLREPGLQLVDAARSYQAAGAPLLAPPPLADAEGDAVDGATVFFLVPTAVRAQAELDRRKREEEKEEKAAVWAKLEQRLQRIDAKLVAGGVLTPWGRRSTGVGSTIHPPHSSVFYPSFFFVCRQPTFPQDQTQSCLSLPSN